VPITDIPDFDKFFPLYKMEHAYLIANDLPAWDASILESKNYLEFTSAHLKNLIKLRFFPEDWPEDFIEFITGKTGKELLELTNYKGDLALEKVTSDPEFSKPSINRLKKGENQPILTDFDNWNGFDMIFDFYRLRSADVLAFPYIGEQRLNQYNLIIKEVLENETFKNAPANTSARKLWLFMCIFKKFLNGQPADHFTIDLKTGDLKTLE
jgi:hypothetical protein